MIQPRHWASFNGTVTRVGAGVAVVAGSLAWVAVARGASPAAAEPRLVLPGSHIVRSGEWIDLRWTDADSISELEILLSTDGGRHYSACISAQLDPRRHEFLWRVPPRNHGTLWMRLRFNRGGREIEGAPASPLTVFPGSKDEPEPLGLPPISHASGNRAPPSSDGRGGVPGGRTQPGLAGVSEGFAITRKSSPRSPTTTRLQPRTRPATVVPAGFVPPRCTPLRA